MSFRESWRGYFDMGFYPYPGDKNGIPIVSVLGDAVPVPDLLRYWASRFPNATTLLRNGGTFRVAEDFPQEIPTHRPLVKTCEAQGILSEGIGQEHGTMKVKPDCHEQNGAEDGAREPMISSDSNRNIPSSNNAGISGFQSLSLEEVGEILGVTIKKDEANKIITFLCCLSAYTEDAQFNISFNAPSSSGKSYIPVEIARLFPDEDVIELAYCSPAAFFHDTGVWDKEGKKYILDLSRKILIFLDQPHMELLARLRPLLSHDKREITAKITDKSEKFGLRTKTIEIFGYPAVIFCTAGLRIDEQEATRFLLLSPETSQEKIREAIFQKIRKESDSLQYQQRLDSHPGRVALKARIKAIRDEKIREVKIRSYKRIEEAFLAGNKHLKARHSRDVGRVMSIIKAIALLNLWFRERDSGCIYASEEDIEEGLKLWQSISEAQELNLPPYIFEIYKSVILSLWEERSELRGGGEVRVGISRRDIIMKHYEIFKENLPDWKLRQDLLPMLETAGLIVQEPDPNNRNRMLIHPPTLQLTASVSNRIGATCVSNGFGAALGAYFLGGIRKADSG